MNRASSVAAAHEYGERWLERYWAEPDASRVSEYGDETVGALLAAGFTLRDISDMQGAGVSERDARAAAAVRTGVQTAQRTGLVPEYDAVYYLNDLLSPHTEVLMTSSAVYGESYYTYGLERLYADDGNGAAQTYLYDGRGSVTATLDRLGTVSALRYTDYGATVGALPDEFVPYYGYNGEEHDPLTGLQYLRARYYDAASGSFTSRDPYEGAADVPLSQNGFTYAHNNPVNYADPSGMAVAAGKVKLINDGGGGVGKTVRAIRAEQAYQKAQQTLSLPRPPMARPGTNLATSLLPAQLEYQRAQTMMYLREGCDPNAARARTQSFASVSFDRDKNIDSMARIIHVLDECGDYIGGSHLTAVKRNMERLQQNVSVGSSEMSYGVQTATIAALTEQIGKTSDPAELANLYRALLVAKEWSVSDRVDLELKNVRPIDIEATPISENLKNIKQQLK